MLSDFKTSTLLILFVVIVGLLGFCLYNLFSPGPLVSAKEIDISSGAGFYEIVNRLSREGVIRSKVFFEIYALATNKASHLKPGRYFLNSHISIKELADVLKNGPQEISVVIFPGMTVKEIDDKLSSLTIIRSGELKNFNVSALKEKYGWLSDSSLEGFLLPDTYNFFTGSDVNFVAKKMLDNFSLKALPFFRDYSNLSKIINLASILEKEVPDYKDRCLVAGILAKRLAENMPLQVDATLLYFKCSGEFANCAGLTQVDYKNDSPYNTYLNNGLPKSAISNPSLEAIKAALNPEKSGYWYYLSDPKTDKTIFSKTLDEHNENRAKFLVNK